jgi:hypothetical protein
MLWVGGEKTYTHGECTTEIIENHPGTWVSRMIHVVGYGYGGSGRVNGELSDSRDAIARISM